MIPSPKEGQMSILPVSRHPPATIFLPVSTLPATIFSPVTNVATSDYFLTGVNVTAGHFSPVSTSPPATNLLPVSTLPATIFSPVSATPIRREQNLHNIFADLLKQFKVTKLRGNGFMNNLFCDIVPLM
jgi:hypothetical protein